MDHPSAMSTNNLANNKPSPLNFEEFIPWACRLLQESFTLKICRSEPYITPAKKEKSVEHHADSEDSVGDGSSEEEYNTYDKVQINTVYDNNNYLVQLKFKDNKKIPRNLLKVIYLIIPFHTNLTAIHINKGLNQETVHELAKILTVSNVTEVILDGTILKEANYYCLLESKSSMTYLSLSRCQINDDVIEKIAAELIYPLPMSKVLVVLNLSSNRITDEGAKYLGEMLKTNRCLAYLNLAGNMITDTGADSIFSNLIEFPISFDELLNSRIRKYAYVREKIYLTKKAGQEINHIMRSGNKSKTDKAILSSSLTKSRDSKFRDLMSKFRLDSGSIGDVVEEYVKMQLGPFTDPYSTDNIMRRDETVYCLGNNTLCYISLAYNDLSCLSVKRLYSVLKTQYELQRSPKGLVNICLDGNDIPEHCGDLANVDFMIESALRSTEIRSSARIPAKKGEKKSASRA